MRDLCLTETGIELLNLKDEFPWAAAALNVVLSQFLTRTRNVENNEQLRVGAYCFTNVKKGRWIYIS